MSSLTSVTKVCQIFYFEGFIFCQIQSRKLDYLARFKYFKVHIGFLIDNEQKTRSNKRFSVFVALKYILSQKTDRYPEGKQQQYKKLRNKYFLHSKQTSFYCFT